MGASERGTPDDWAERAGARLAAAGYRHGGARSRLIEMLSNQHCALSAVELQAALEDGDRRVSRASIYRILEELERAELVARIEVGQGIVRFEPLRHGAGHHHHLVCESCGKVEAFEDDRLEQALRRVEQQTGYSVAGHDVILRGACAACS